MGMSSSRKAGSSTAERNTSGTASRTPGHTSPSAYGLIADSWSKPRMYAPAAEKTTSYSSPPPLRIENHFSPSRPRAPKV